MTHFRDLLEPAAAENAPQAEEAIISIAISLKRIADLLDANLGADAVNAWGETPFEAVGGNLARALAK